jgi:predicted DNA-binding transcriptional regulator AlpA
MLMSIREFCADCGISRATFYTLMRQGEGPRVMKIGDRTLISRESAAEWIRSRERATLAGWGTAK